MTIISKNTTLSSSSTTSTSSTALVNTKNIPMMRPRDIQVSVQDARPSSRMYVFFDGVSVNEFITPTNGSRGQPIYTNSVGEVNFTFTVENGRWQSGTREMIVADTPNLSDFEVLGTVNGKATAFFNSAGTMYEYQVTVVNTTTNNYTKTITNKLPPTFRVDPLAQSFFTYGDKGGIFVTSIDLFFRTAPSDTDPQLPVRVELRPMVNGFPSDYTDSSLNSTAIVNAEIVRSKLSEDSSVPTTFTFPYPVYLKEDRDYCFVVLTNSAKYNLWTSKLGERDKISQRIIFDQPFVGSMFKSQNNYTWTPEQTEDIKFTLKKAKFALSSGTVNLYGQLPNRAVFGSNFETKLGSTSVIYRSPQQHGLTVASYIDISAQPLGSYNGIPAANLTGSFLIPSNGIIDEYTLRFNTTVAATTSGVISNCNTIYYITVVNGGSGYSISNPPAIKIDPAPSGDSQTATPVIIDGRIVGINLTGTQVIGYRSVPRVSIDAPVFGTTAVAVAVIDAIFTVSINKPIHTITPKINVYEHENTRIVSTLTGTNATYGSVGQLDLPLNKVSHLDSELLAASIKNEITFLAGNKSVALSLNMITSNENVSPLFFANKPNDLIAYSRAINNQAALDKLENGVSSSGIIDTSVSTVGSNYTVAPVVNVYPAENDKNYANITAATLTATVFDGKIVPPLTIVSGGSGYTKPPIIVIAAPSSGTAATAVAYIQPINSELNTVGSALTRYISKRISLSETSTAIKLVASIYSTPEMSVEWYIRSSLGVNSTTHTASQWVRMLCDTNRNKSAKNNQFFDYVFYLNDMAEYDTYDLKAVLSSATKLKTPIIRNFRVITAM